MKIIPEAALNQHIAILGKTGSGKTYAAKGIVEQLLGASRQVCVIDPTGAWWGLRLAGDGKARGFDVVLLGGKHADIPLAPRSGEAVARLVTQQRASVVIDTSGLSVGEYTRWFIDFAGTLYTTIREPLHVVIDEAHYFMPQGRVPDPEAGKMLHAGNRLMSGGRSLGIRGMLITQRPAKLHKDSLTCADTLIAMRVIAPQDRGAIRDWIDGAGDPAQGKAVLDSLAQLKRGEGWVWYPEGGHLQRVTFPKIKTYDSSATPTHGAKAGPTVSEIKLDEVRQAMAEAVKEAEANDPKILRAKISDLSKQLSKSAAVVQTDPKAIERAVTSAVAARDKEWHRLIKWHEQKLAQACKTMRQISGLVTGLDLSPFENGGQIPKLNGEAAAVNLPSKIIPNAIPTSAPPKDNTRNNLRTSAQNRATSPVASAIQKEAVKYAGNYAQDDGGNSQLGKAERAILTALYWLRGEETTLAKIGFYSNYTVEGGSFKNAIGRLRTLGLVRGIEMTADGETEAAGFVTEDKPVGSELREWLRRKLGKAENMLLDALCEAYPKRLQDEELGAAAGYESTGGSYKNALGRLRTIEAAEGYARDGGTKASDVFFE